ncbi:MAG: tetratricopeptide repeat protein [Acidobacteriaceae bacterium]
MLSPTAPANAISPRDNDLYHQGMVFLTDKRYAEALKQFKELERIAPHSPEGYTGEGIALALIGKPEEATAALCRAVAIDPRYWVARRELGIIDWQLQRREEAAAELLLVIQAVPEDRPISAILGEYYFEKKRYSDAARFFTKAGTQLSANHRLILMASAALIRCGNSKQGLEQLDRLNAPSKLEPQEQFQMAWLLGEAQAYSQAIHMFQTLPPDFADAVGRDYGLALAYYENGQYLNCIQLLRTLRDRGVDRADIVSLLGAAEDADGEARLAYEIFRDGMRRFPRDDDNYLNAATVAVQSRDYATAAQVLTSGIDQIPQDYKLFLVRGVVNTLSGDLKTAESDYKTAVSLAPDQSSTYVALGICFMDQGRDNPAANILRQGINKGMVDVRLNYYLVDALFKQGFTAESPLYREATIAVNAGIQADPEFAYGYLQRARLQRMTGRVQDAIEDLEHAQKLEPNSTAILYQLAREYRSAGRTADANRVSSRVSEIVNQHVEDDRHSTLMSLMGSAGAAKFAEK